MSDIGNVIGTTFKRIQSFLKLPSNAGALTPHWLAGSKIPAVLANFYASNSTPFNVITCMQFFDNAGNYSYLAWLFAPTTHEILLAFGNVNAGSVSESFFLDFDPSTTTPRATIFGDAFGARSDGMSWAFNGVVGAALDPSVPAYSSVSIGRAVDLLIDGNSAARGVQLFVATSALFTAGIAHAALFGNANSCTFRFNRAYKISWGGRQIPSLSTNMMAVNILVGGVSEAKGGSFGPVGGGTFSVACHGSVMVGNPNLAFTKTIDLDVFTDAGTAAIQGGAPDAFYMMVEDMGSLTKFPNAITIT